MKPPASAVTVTASWAGTLTALSSIAHGGQTRGTITLLRREQLLVDGHLIHVPIVSGNSWRGRLRRIGEELTREVLAYEGQLSLAAAHALRGGGSLVKTSGEPLSGSRLRQARTLLPQLAVFGGAVGRTIDGALQVGKLIPHIAETQHLTGRPGPPGLGATQLESYTRVDDSTTADVATLTATPLHPDGQVDEHALTALDERSLAGAGSIVYRVETFPAGTTFSTWLRLERVTPLVLAFFTDVLTEFEARGRVGGRVAIGHGQVRTSWECATRPEQLPELPDWRAHLLAHRGEVLEVIRALG